VCQPTTVTSQQRRRPQNRSSGTTRGEGETRERETLEGWAVFLSECRKKYELGGWGSHDYTKDRGRRKVNIITTWVTTNGDVKDKL